MEGAEWQNIEVLTAAETDELQQLMQAGVSRPKAFISVLHLESLESNRATANSESATSVGDTVAREREENSSVDSSRHAARVVSRAPGRRR